MSTGFNRSDIVDFFLVEASEHLQILNDGLLALEENNENLGVVDEIFRSAHTIKGSAAMLGFNVISKLAHKMEDLLGKVRNQEIQLSESIIDLFLQTVDSLTTQVEDIPNGVQEDESLLLMFSDLYAEFLDPTAGGGGEAKPPAEAADEEPVETIEESEAVNEPETVPDASEAFDDHELVESYELLQELEIPVSAEEPKEPEEETPGELIETEEPEESAPVVVAARPASAAKPAAKRARTETPASLVSAGEKKVVRVGVEGLNLLMNLVGELVINRTRLDQRIIYLNKIGYELNFSQDRLLKVIQDFKEKYEFSQSSKPEIGHGLPPTPRREPANQKSALLDGFFDLEFDQYDDFNILSRSLMEIGSDISEIMSQLTSFFDEFKEESSRIRQTTDSLQEEITNIRMVEIGQLFNRFHRTVRDVGKEESKSVHLTIAGADAKLDKTVVDEIADPLMHLVRNAVSHGIESAQERSAKGKPPEGEVSLNAYKEGDNIIIEVGDDGNGIDVQRIREAIAEKGLRSIAEIERLSDDEAMRFIFMPGFSTKKNVSAISGRGVGMDVVKTNITRLGGAIDIKTELGQGTRFLIKLPLTLVIYAALLVKSGEQEFAISLTSVEETARIPINHVYTVGSREVIKLRDQVLPIRRLNDILQYTQGTQPEAGQGYMPVVIVRSTDQTMALMVDELIGRETIVVKPLGDYLKNVRLFSGATISGEGKVRLILDIPTIIDREISPPKPARTPSPIVETYIPDEFAEEEVVAQEAAKTPEILLVDDSISIRKMVGMFLSNANYQVETATDGLDALEKVENARFDLIVTDLEMPKMHGYELISELRHRDEWKKVPIIVLTSRSGDKHQNKAMELGANDYIIKPVDEETLLTSVKKFLGR